jgi:hypothetical protein
MHAPTEELWEAMFPVGSISGETKPKKSQSRLLVGLQRVSTGQWWTDAARRHTMAKVCEIGSRQRGPERRNTEVEESTALRAVTRRKP